MRVKLTKKLAEVLDGIDLSASEVGDVLNLTRRDASLLIQEGWAHAMPQPILVYSNRIGEFVPHLGTDWARRHPVELPRVGQPLWKRRAEDRIREDLQEARAKIVRVRSA